MKIFGWNITRNATAATTVAEMAQEPVRARDVQGVSLFTVSNFDGEKNLGDIGPIKDYKVDYAALSARGWQSYLDSEICQLAIRRFSRWVIGDGLKLQAQPSDVVLKMQGIPCKKNFSEQVEALWHLYAEDKAVDIKGINNLGQIAKIAFEAAKIGGNVLVILRVVQGVLQVQLVDGANVVTPLVEMSGYGDNALYTATGNRVIDGVEIDAHGKPIAYHVCTGVMKHERIVARDSSGRLVAWLLTGLRHRLSSTRAMPLYTAVLETVAKLERYKEATVGSAEEAAKVTFTAEHQAYSTGENPLMAQLVKSYGAGRGAGSGDQPTDYNGNNLSSTVAATTGKTLINLPIGASMKAVESKKEVNFSGFYGPNVNIVFSVIGIPPDVAMMLYNSNFSASRAALKDWEHTLYDERVQFKREFYMPIYEYWLDLQVLQNRIDAPGYLTALMKQDRYTLIAYRKCLFIGVNVPHIDPLKEVNAERAKLGIGSEHIPLTTVDKATTNLNGGDYWENMKNYASELKEAEEEGIAIAHVYTPIRDNKADS